MQVSRPRAFLTAAILSFCLLLFPDRASAQYLVDCSGNTAGAYTTINAILPLLTNGAVVQINGTCQENVTITGINNLWIGAPWGQTATLRGNLNIRSSQNFFLYGMNVSNPSGNGIGVGNSLGVVLDTCTASNNHGTGLSIGGGSAVNVQNSGTFNNNDSFGIEVTNNSILSFGWGGHFDISNNVGDGIYAERSVLYGLGNINIANNKANPGFNTTRGFGIMFAGAATGVLWEGAGPTTITGNEGGGVGLIENSEISLAAPAPPSGYSTIVQANGPVGISAGIGSQLTLYEGVQVTGHTDTGIDVWANSQAFVNGGNQITGNGSGFPSSTHAGIRVDGNSEAYIRNGVISQNGGPGILALVNSSIDLSGVSFIANAGGPVQCDSSASMTADLTTRPVLLGPHPPCNVPNSFPTRPHVFSPPHMPNWPSYKASEDKYQQLMSIFKRN